MIRSFIPQGVCLACRGCCRFSEAESVWTPSLTREEVGVLVANKVPPLLISPEGRLRLVSVSDGGFVCPFLDPPSNACRIYGLRPLECRLYPFVINRGTAGEVHLALDTQCPYASAHLKDRVTAEYAEYLTEVLSAPEQAVLIRENPCLIQAYPGAVNLRPLGALRDAAKEPHP